MRRSDQRREATFVIYQHDVTGRDLDELLLEAKPFTRALAEGTAGEIESLDAKIGAHARGWRIERIAPLEKAIMRVALYEIHHRDDVPTPVAIDEAVSIAGRYCGADAPGFVNGVLSAASRGGSAAKISAAAPAEPEPEPGDPRPTEDAGADPEAPEPKSADPEPLEPEPADPEPLEPKSAEPEPLEPAAPQASEPADDEATNGAAA